MNMKITHRMGVFFCFIGTTVFAGAQVVMDSTLGQAGPLAGPNFQIPAKLGKTVGNGAVAVGRRTRHHRVPTVRDFMNIPG